MILTHPNLRNVKINKNKPLIICDADEVIFDFMTSFEAYLKSNNLHFNWSSYSLSNNIVDQYQSIISDQQIEVIINKFFDQNTSNMKLVEGSKKSLNKLSKYFDIIILSNIPKKNYLQRKKTLIKNNINYPLICNSGGKGISVKQLINNHKSLCWFIDDSPNQINSVKYYNNTIKTLNLIINKELLKLSGIAKTADKSANTWRKAEKIILEDLENYLISQD